jgi:nucleotidyltransferase substrate binding protein (TIGR01987 family)
MYSFFIVMMAYHTQQISSPTQVNDLLSGYGNQIIGILVRDAAIQRFEYTFETTWKVLKVYLKEREGIIANSPKSVFREALSVGILDANHTELALEMTDDRNLTSHTYLEQVAQQIFEKLPAYRDLMNQLLMQIDALR